MKKLRNLKNQEYQPIQQVEHGNDHTQPSHTKCYEPNTMRMFQNQRK